MKKVMFVICFFINVQLAHAATYTCGVNERDNSCTPAGMTSLISSANDGDTINIATGTHNWTSTVTVKKRVTINGGGTYAVDSQTPVPNDAGTWPVQLNNGAGNNAFLINVTSAGSDTVVISGLHIIGDSPGNYNCYWNYGMISEHLSNVAPVRITNCKFHNTTSNDYGITIHTKSVNTGVLVDHCYFIDDNYERKTLFVQRVTNYEALNDPQSCGNYAWEQPMTFGGSDFTFVEDSTFWNDGTGIDINNGPIVVDAHTGGKLVFRYNKVRNGMVTIHSMSNGAWTRSGVSMEVYGNTFNRSVTGGTTYQATAYIRSGNVLYYNNTISGTYDNAMKFSDPTQEGSRDNWGTVTGSNTCDGNWGGGYPTGYPLMDQIGFNSSPVTFDGVKPSAGTKSQVQSQTRTYSRLYNNTLNGINLLTQYEYSGLPGSGYIVQDRDYILSADPAYSAYPYPHPFVSGSPVDSGTFAPNPPTNLRIL